MNLRDELQQALGDAFVIERELTGGGMSRVFLAREPRLEREVVIKVLAPQLAAGVQADRFAREIKLAAGLQHPHIVPVLTAGAAGELLYYIMPHVAGQSVADRLEEARPLALPEAARILRDVADALAYAHGKGIVHRDIKPANVLLSGSHGMVTDFGVAKALGTPDSKLTGTGFALGTPAYMAPEQAAGDPATDHRADFYAFGALAYEMLTGELIPKKGPDRRKLPGALVDLVWSCLSPDPAGRPQHASELVAALEAVTAAGTGAARRRKRGMPEITLIAVGALVGLTVVIAVLRGGTKPTNIDPNLVAILPFRVAGADSGLHYLREGMIDLLAAKLTGEAGGGPRAADPQSVMSAWRGKGGTETSDVPQDAAVALALGLGAGEVLTGGVVGSARQLTITATIVNTDDAAVRASSSVVGPADSVPALVDRLAGQLLVRSASLDEALATRSIAALRAYLAGRASYRRGNYDVAVQHLARALAHDSTFTQAALWFLCAQSWGVVVPDLERVQRIAWHGRERLSGPDRARLEAILGTTYPETPLRSETLVYAERAVELSRDNPDAWYLFGDAYFHDGAYLGYEDWSERSRAALERAMALDSGFADPIGHLVVLAGMRDDTADVRRLAPLYLATEGARRGQYSVVVRWQIAHTLGDAALAAEAMQAIDTVAALPTTLPFIVLHHGEHDQLAAIVAALTGRASTRGERIQNNIQRVTILLNQGRLRAALALADSARLSPASLRVQAAIYGVNPDTAVTSAAVRDLARIAAGPQATDPRGVTVQYGTLALLGQWAALNGDAAGAARAAARFRSGAAAPTPVARYTAIWAELLDGFAAALRGQGAGRAHADKADSLLRLGPELWPPYVENIVLARLYDALGDVPRALAAVRRGSPQAINLLQTWLLHEEGRLAAKAGDAGSAVKAFKRYLTMLHNPDPEVAALAEAVRREIALLDRD